MNRKYLRLIIMKTEAERDKTGNCFINAQAVSLIGFDTKKTRRMKYSATVNYYEHDVGHRK